RRYWYRNSSSDFLADWPNEAGASQSETRQDHPKFAGECNVDEETNKIKEHIDTERNRLGQNLDEIESRVKNATDLRAQFNKHTGWILGGAVAGGFLLSLAFRKPSNRDTRARWEGDAT